MCADLIIIIKDSECMYLGTDIDNVINVCIFATEK